MSAERVSSSKMAGPPVREPRVRGLRGITVAYEGRREEIVIKPPDLSSRGMFISTAKTFPEGAVLNLRFRLERSGAEVQTRSEVRYCLPGVGVGVEFIGISPGEQQKIAAELKLEASASSASKRGSRKARSGPRGNGSRES